MTIWTFSIQGRGKHTMDSAVPPSDNFSDITKGYVTTESLPVTSEVKC